MDEFRKCFTQGQEDFAIKGRLSLLVSYSEATRVVRIYLILSLCLYLSLSLSPSISVSLFVSVSVSLS